MKKEIFIHIGDAKTGTSSIQNYLSYNRLELKKKGILYSKTGLLSEKGIANHKLAFCVNSNQTHYHAEAQNLYADLDKEINETKCNKIIVSSEGFCSLRTLDEIRILKIFLDKYKPKIIVYLRRPDLWIESWYMQIVKQKPFISKTFEEYLKNHQEPSLRTIINYSKVFGKKNILARPFETDKMFNNNLIDDFFNLIGCEKIGKSVEDINRSPDVYVTELLRTLNATIHMDEVNRIKLNTVIVKYLKLSNTKKYFSLNIRKYFLKKYHDDILKIDEIFGNNMDFFNMSLKEYQNYNFNPKLSEKEMIGLSEFINIISDLNNSSFKMSKS